jgi:hypothetical protein
MRNRALSTVSVAVASGILLCPQLARAQAPDAQASTNNTISAATESAAAQLVPAQAVLDKDLDARKARPGQEFRATLADTIHLKNGMELPRGTALVGTIAAEQTQSSGESRLALRFTRAQLKDGKTIPIQATIFGVAPPSTSDSWDHSDGEAAPEPWNGSALQVDDVGVLSGVDLHSTIAGENSGVFVSRKSGMKLAARSQMSLAIGVQAIGGMS